MDLRRASAICIAFLLHIKLRTNAVENNENGDTALQQATIFNFYNYFTAHGNGTIGNNTNLVAKDSDSQEPVDDLIARVGQKPFKFQILDEVEISDLCKANGYELSSNEITSTTKKNEIDIFWKPLGPPRNCGESYLKGLTGVYNIKLASGVHVAVYCEKDWTVVQLRDKGTVNFNRNIGEYISGFGELKGEFWMGLELLHQLTSSQAYELNIVLRDSKGTRKYARYENFRISSYEDGYKLLSLGAYKGDAGDSLTSLLYKAFSAKEADNDDSYYTHCAEDFRSGWWYKDCTKMVYSDLNGEFGRNNPGTGGIIWSTFDADRSLKYSKMTIRPRG